MAFIASKTLVNISERMSDKTCRIVSLYVRCMSCYRGNKSVLSSVNLNFNKSCHKNHENDTTGIKLNTKTTDNFKKIGNQCNFNSSKVFINRDNLHLSNLRLNGRILSYRFSSYASFGIPAIMPLKPKSNVVNTISQMYSTHVIDKPGLLSRIWNKIGPRKLRYKNGTLSRSGYRLYCCIDEFVDYDKFIEELELPDTFASWFLIMELHAWMVMVRLATEADEGNIVRQSILKGMWSDVETRSKRIGSDATERKKGVKNLADMFIAGMFAYDEGLLSDDKTLAAAVWRIIYNTKNVDPEKVELMVHYIRKQVKHLENQNSELLLRNGLISFLPLHAEKMDPEHEKRTFAKALGNARR